MYYFRHHPRINLEFVVSVLFALSLRPQPRRSFSTFSYSVTSTAVQQLLRFVCTFCTTPFDQRRVRRQGSFSHNLQDLPGRFLTLSPAQAPDISSRHHYKPTSKPSGTFSYTDSNTYRLPVLRRRSPSPVTATIRRLRL